ncbi:amino acid permease [Plectosphaerella plurivora]|uniref:Amino acid permease n=1 Tax=Plectosphaerella plurivora TaxID=936078 RepID=A0A9P8V0E2_9PEZI|nr:amino acid permease [Plectosphaerella plurivora]
MSSSIKETALGGADELKARDPDAEILVALGHTQELERKFSLLSICALCSCLMATWEALATVIGAALAAGGGPCLIYNYIISFIFTMCITFSLAEIASVYPTAGGQYHWVSVLSPKSTRNGASWITGWISVWGQTIFAAYAAFAAGLQIQGLIVMNNPLYEPTRWQGMLLYWAVLAYACVLNVWGDKLLTITNNISGVIHIGAFLAITVVLFVKSEKNSAAFVFLDVVNSTGWSNDGIAWLVGLLSATYPFLGYDSVCHLAEELPDARRNVPIAMTPTGFPFMAIYQGVTESAAAASAMSVIVPIIGIAAVTAGVASASRTVWAFARDHGSPFHEQLSVVHKTRKVPVNAILTIAAVQALLGLIYLGNSTAFNAILSMAVISMYLSYLLPIKKQLLSLDFPTWLGCIFNIASIVWISVVIVFSTFPATMPATPGNMNYSSVVTVGYLVFGLVYYLYRGRRKFRVPTV